MWSIAERERRAAVLFERIEAGIPLAKWAVVGAPAEVLREEPLLDDVLLIQTPDRTGISRVVRSAGDWVLAADHAGTRWRRISDGGMLRENVALVRHAPQTLAENTPPPLPPQLDENTPVTLVDEADLPRLRTELRLANIAPQTRTFLTVAVKIAGTHPGATLLQDAKAARDAIDKTLQTGTLGKAASAATALIKAADKVVTTTAYDEIVKLAGVTDIDKLDGATAMKQLADARERMSKLIGLVDELGAIVSKAKARDIRKSTAIAADATTLATKAKAVRDWLRDIKKKTKWDSSKLAKFVDRKRDGGSLDRDHLKRATVGRELAGKTLARVPVWHLIGKGDVFGSKLVKDLAIEKVPEAVKAAFSAAFDSDKADNPDDTIVEPCIDAMVAAFPALAGQRDPLRVTARELIEKVAGDRKTATTGTALKRVTDALADRATQGFAQDLLDTATSLWPFEKQHFLERALKAFDSFGTSSTSFDIFELVGKNLVVYNFFGQDPVTISKDLVDALTSAERHYFGMRAQFPGTSFIVAAETGGWNYRLWREKVLRKILLRGPKGFFVHTVGRAIDVNYPDGRNPHVTQPEAIWDVVKSVLRFAAAQATTAAETKRLTDLAAVDFGASPKPEGTLFKILEASRQFRIHFAAWETATPQSFVVPQTSWPTVDAYSKALVAAGLGPKDKQVAKVKRVHADAKTAEAKAREAVLARARSAVEAWGKDIVAIRKRKKAFLASDKPSQMARMRIAMRSAKEQDFADLRAAVADFELAREAVRKAREPDLASAGDAVIAASRAVRARLEQEALAQGIDVTAMDLTKARKDSKWTTAAEYYAGFVALLPSDASWQRVTDAAAALATARQATAQAAADPLLARYWQGRVDLDVIKGFRKHKKLYQRWGQQGFTDHDPVYLWAMLRGGFTWGGEFSEPDLHHFEIKTGLDFKGNW
jgi:hypothetical protein